MREIRIEGTQRVDPDTVRSYLQVQPGEPYDATKLDASLKALYATGLFSDVHMQRQGDALVVHVVENPVINRIQFEGNSKLTDDNLNNEVQLRPRLVFTREKVQADVVRILELYRRSGHFAATVQPKVIELPQNRVDLVFEIDEGPVDRHPRHHLPRQSAIQREHAARHHLDEGVALVALPVERRHLRSRSPDL